jgi:hypothetical protein
MITALCRHHTVQTDACSNTITSFEQFPGNGALARLAHDQSPVRLATCLSIVSRVTGAAGENAEEAGLLGGLSNLGSWFGGATDETPS